MNDIPEQYFSDPRTANAMIKLIKTIVQKELRNLQFDKTYSGVVTGVNGNNANIKIMGSESIVNNVKNKSGEVLVTGDDVLIEAINNSLNNIVIKYKK